MAEASEEEDEGWIVPGAGREAKARREVTHNQDMNDKADIANAAIQAEVKYIESIRKSAPAGPERALLERETHDALNKFLTVFQG